jgi:hypothetical protein
MTTLQSMVSNLTRPYRQGAYVREIELGHLTDQGLTPIPDYGLDDYAVCFGIPPWDIEPVYLIAPRFDLDDEYICLYFDLQGWPADRPWPQVRIPAHTPAGTTFIIPLGAGVNGLTRLTALREWPEPRPEAPSGRERWQILLLVGNLGRLLWTLGREKAHLGAVAQVVGDQRKLALARGYSLDLIGRELHVPRLLASPYPVDPATIALYHLNRVPDDTYDLTTVGSRVIDETARYHGQNRGATRGMPGRIDRAFAFRSGDLPRPQCATEYEFQQRLRSGDWDPMAGEREVRYGPYRTYGYREGAIVISGPDGEPHGVWVNDEAEDPTVRGQLTSACYGFVPTDLEETIERFNTQGRTVQAAIDYFGHWWGRPEEWFTATYVQYGLEAPHERCVFVETPLTYVRIPNRGAFDIPADQNFTIEAFIRPTPTTDNRLRIIAIKSHEVFYGGLTHVHCIEGWALSMGTFNCIPNNVAWSISDLPDYDEAEHGQRLVTVTADLDLGDGRWHHVAGVIDRRYQVIRLYVDGVERGCQSISQVGQIVNQEDILLGINDYHFDAPYDGLIDEVRFSNVARRSFHPLLGESDARYRTRLSIYRPWLIPTYDNIRAGLHRLLHPSPYGPEVPAPELPGIEVIEQDSARLCTEQLFKIRPLSLPPGARIDLEGDRQISEEAAGGPRDEQFYAWQLLTHDDAAVEYAAPNARRMQLATLRSLDNLLRLLQPWMEKTGQKLQLLGAYEPGRDSLRAVGRALHLHMEGLPTSVLAAFAHKACFDYVEHTTYLAEDGSVIPAVRAVVREELDKLEIVTQDEVDNGRWPGREDSIQVKVGDDPLQLTVARPAGPDKRYFKWLLIECGPARGQLQPVGGDNASRLFIPTAPGRLIVKVEFNWQGTIIAGRREIQIGLHMLPPCESIGGDGALGVSEEEAAGKPEGFFHEALLLEHDDPAGRVDYGADPNHHRVQLGLEKMLNRLLELIAQEPDVTGRLRLLKGYDPTADDLARVGRKLMLVHEDEATMPLGRLAALAHDAGFAWVSHPPYPEGIFVATGPESPLEIIPGPIEYLAPNAVINWLGLMRPDVPEAPVMPGTTFDATEPANRHDDPGRVTYADERSHLMTPATQEKLNALLDRLDEAGATGQLHILGAFEDTATNRRQIGTALQIRHDSVPLAHLGALTHQVGFDYVKHVTVPSDPAEHHIYASVWRGEDFSGLIAADIAEIVDYGLLDLSDYSEVAEGGVRRLGLRPDVLAWTPPPIIEAEADEVEEQPPANEREAERPSYQLALPEAAHYYWCLTRYGPGQGRLDSPPAPYCKLFTAQRAGVVGTRGEFVLGDATEPYRFELVAKKDQQGHVAPIPKLVYDDLMNFLEFRRPIGVEGCTLTLRQHVPQLMADRARRDASTEQTFPRYRQRRGAVGRIDAGGAEIREITCACPPWQSDSQEEVNDYANFGK